MRALVVVLLLLHLLLLVAVWSAGCGGGSEDCALPPLERPAQDATLPWLQAPVPIPIVGGELNGAPARLLLDTGYPHSAVVASRLGAGGATFSFGGARSGPWPPRVLDPAFAEALGIDAVVGADVLAQLAWRMDARARTVTLLADAAPGGHAVARLRPGACALQSPVALVVDAQVEERPLRLLLDTGAQLTLVRTAHADALAADGRAQLTGLRVQTGFAGAFTATAIRARSSSVADAEATNSPLLSAVPADAYLDRLAADYGERVDGLLGWSFLREFAFTFADGTLSVDRYEDPSHGPREFLGIGILRSPSTSPPGVRVDGFLGTSPARDAGVLPLDVITRVGGQPLLGHDPIPGVPGQTLTLELHRPAVPDPLDVEVTYADLLPDPD